jgi:RNA polymerase sigma-70 factor (ECF subfamily)
LQRILEFYKRCQAAEYGFSPEEFCGLLRDIADRATGGFPNESEQVQWLSTLHLDDLVLAHACARGHEAAWERFVGLYGQKLYAASLTIARQESLAHELADSVYADLFGTQTGNDGKRKSKLELYSGRGSLAGWLRSVLAQTFVNQIRHERKLVAFSETVEPCAQPKGIQDLTSDSRVIQSVDAELAALDAEDKLLLAAYYLDGRTLAETGRMMNLHESTVTRRLGKITARLRKRIIARLCAAGIPKRAAEEMLNVDVRDLAINVRKGLAQEGRG